MKQSADSFAQNLATTQVPYLLRCHDACFAQEVAGKLGKLACGRLLVTGQREGRRAVMLVCICEHQRLCAQGTVAHTQDVIQHALDGIV